MTQGISIAAAADRLAVSEKTIRRYITQGRIKAERIGPRLIRVDPTSLETLGSPLQWTGE